MRLKLNQFTKFLGVVLVVGAFVAGDERPGAAHRAPDGWRDMSPRKEIRPSFSYEAKRGPEDAERLIIMADEREGLAGFWTRSLVSFRQACMNLFDGSANLAVSGRSKPATRGALKTSHIEQ